MWPSVRSPINECQEYLNPMRTMRAVRTTRTSVRLPSLSMHCLVFDIIKYISLSSAITRILSFEKVLLKNNAF